MSQLSNRNTAKLDRRMRQRKASSFAAMTSLEKEMAREKRKSDVLIAAKSLDNEIQSVKDLKRLSIGSMDLVTDPELEFRMSSSKTNSNRLKRKTWTPDTTSLSAQKTLQNANEDDSTSYYFSFTEDSESSLMSNSSLETTKAEYLHADSSNSNDNINSNINNDKVELYNYNDRRRALLLTRRRLSGASSMKTLTSFDTTTKGQDGKNNRDYTNNNNNNNNTSVDSVTRSLLWVPANQHPNVKPEGYIELVQNTLQGIHFDDREEREREVSPYSEQSDKENILIIAADEYHTRLSDEDIKKQRNVKRRPSKLRRSYTELDTDMNEEELKAHIENYYSADTNNNNDNNNNTSPPQSELKDQATNFSQSDGGEDRTTGTSISIFDRLRKVSLRDITEELAKISNRAGLVDNDAITLARTLGMTGSFSTPKVTTSSAQITKSSSDNVETVENDENADANTAAAAVATGETSMEEDTYASNIVMNNEGSTLQRSSLRRSKFNTYRIKSNPVKPVNLHAISRSMTSVQEQGQEQRQAQAQEQQQQSQEPLRRESISGNKLPWLGRSKNKVSSGKINSPTQRDVQQQQQGQQQQQQDALSKKESFEEKFIKLFRRKSHSSIERARSSDRGDDFQVQREIKKKISKFQRNTKSHPGISNTIRAEQLLPAYEDGLETSRQSDLTSGLTHAVQQEEQLLQGQLLEREEGEIEIEEVVEEELPMLQPAVSVTSTKDRAFTVSNIYNESTVPNGCFSQSNDVLASEEGTATENDELDKVQSHSSTSSRDSFQDALQDISNGEIQESIDENTFSDLSESLNSETTQEQCDEDNTNNNDGDSSSNETVSEQARGLGNETTNNATVATGTEPDVDMTTEGLDSPQQQQQQPTVTSTLPPRKLTFADVKRPEKANAPMQFTDSAFGFPLPALTTSTVIMFDYRLDINVERAIYRLSHLKLSDPKRELRQQVLLSNFMYAYLNLVNHTLYMEQFAANEEAEAEGIDNNEKEKDIMEQYKGVDISGSPEDEDCLEKNTEESFEYNESDGFMMANGMSADPNTRNYTYDSGPRTEYTRDQSTIPDYSISESNTNGAVLIPEV